MIIEYKINNGFKSVVKKDTSDDTMSAPAPPNK